MGSAQTRQGQGPWNPGIEEAENFLSLDDVGKFIKTVIACGGDIQMSSSKSCVIAGQKIDFSNCYGLVEDVQSWTTHETWSEGGGGYVHPEYGGYVEAPVIRSSSSHHIRIRIGWDDGRHSSIDVPGNVQVCNGDRIVFIGAGGARSSVWQWVGVVNITTESFFVLGDAMDVVVMPLQSYIDKFGFFFMKLLSGARGNKFWILIIFGGILSSILMIPISFVLGVFSKSLASDSFVISGIAVAIAIYVGTSGVKQKLEEIRKEFDDFRMINVDGIMRLSRRPS